MPLATFDHFSVGRLLRIQQKLWHVSVHRQQRKQSKQWHRPYRYLKWLCDFSKRSVLFFLAYYNLLSWLFKLLSLERRTSMQRVEERLFVFDMFWHSPKECWRKPRITRQGEPGGSVTRCLWLPLTISVLAGFWGFNRSCGTSACTGSSGSSPSSGTGHTAT